MVEVIHNGMIAGEIYPVLVGSAAALIGIDTLAEFIVDFAPNPLERPTAPHSPRRAHGRSERDCRRLCVQDLR